MAPRIATFKNGNLVSETPASAAEIAEQSDAAEIKAVIDAIDNITTVAGLRTALKKLVVRLAKKGYLP